MVPNHHGVEPFAPFHDSGVNLVAVGNVRRGDLLLVRRLLDLGRRQCDRLGILLRLGGLLPRLPLALNPRVLRLEPRLHLGCFLGLRRLLCLELSLHRRRVLLFRLCVRRRLLGVELRLRLRQFLLRLGSDLRRLSLGLLLLCLRLLRREPLRLDVRDPLCLGGRRLGRRLVLHRLTLQLVGNFLRARRNRRRHPVGTRLGHLNRLLCFRHCRRGHRFGSLGRFLHGRVLSRFGQRVLCRFFHRGGDFVGFLLRRLHLVLRGLLLRSERLHNLIRFRFRGFRQCGDTLVLQRKVLGGLRDLHRDFFCFHELLLQRLSFFSRSLDGSGSDLGEGAEGDEERGR